MKICYRCFKQYDAFLDLCPYCGCEEISEPKQPIYLTPGTIVGGRYIIGDAEDSGGFGIVYRAWDSKLETIVAVKEFFPTRLVTRAAGTKNIIISKKVLNEFTYRKERFLAEARTMAKFSSEKNITHVYEYFEENNTAYFVMELLKGTTLSKYLQQQGEALPQDLAVFIAGEIANALKALHANKIIHRDVAPDNIFLCEGKQITVKLIDFGAAKLTDVEDTVVDIILKPGYTPCEQYDNKKTIGPWTDIYALGATMYVMLTGSKPDESTNRKIKDEVLPPHEVNPEIDESLSNVVMKAMAVDRHMRFKDIDEFLLALNGEKKVLSIEKERRLRSFKRTTGIVIAAAVLGIVSIIVAGTFSNKRAEDVLKPAEISVWFSVAEGASEEDAMKSIIADFEGKFPGVKVNYRAIPEARYEAELSNAAGNGTLPDLFESTLLPDSLLESCMDLNVVMKSEQYKECLFLDQYDKYYSDRKRMPLGMELLVAYVITGGNVQLDYGSDYFSNISDFGTGVNVSFDSRYEGLLRDNFDISGLSGRAEFFNKDNNTSPVLLSSSMIINEVRSLTYDKKYVYCDAPNLKCRFTYEWSICEHDKNEKRAAEMLLSWMLGNVYQRELMVNSGGNSQVPEIPINRECFETKLRYLHNLTPIEKIYKNFVFVR